MAEMNWTWCFKCCCINFPVTHPFSQSSFHIRIPRTRTITPDSSITFTSRPDWNRATTPKKFPKAAFLTRFWKEKKIGKTLLFPERLDFTCYKISGARWQKYPAFNSPPWEENILKSNPLHKFKNCSRAPLHHTDKSHLKQGQMTMSSTSNF